MNGIVFQRPRARQDLINIFRYYARKAGLQTARRFLVQAETTFIKLAATPGLGVPYEADFPALGEIRVFTISRFKKYLAFYRPITEGIEIIRVLHGSRDIDPILMDDFGIQPEEES
jgi:toxin ParE1/3/4